MASTAHKAHGFFLEFHLLLIPSVHYLVIIYQLRSGLWPQQKSASSQNIPPAVINFEANPHSETTSLLNYVIRGSRIRPNFFIGALPIWNRGKKQHELFKTVLVMMRVIETRHQRHVNTPNDVCTVHVRFFGWISFTETQASRIHEFACSLHEIDMKRSWSALCSLFAYNLNRKPISTNQNLAEAPHEIFVVIPFGAEKKKTPNRIVIRNHVPISEPPLELNHAANLVHKRLRRTLPLSPFLGLHK